MNIQILIDAIVQQTTVLIAQLATAGGVRAPLAHVANQVFLDLTEALESQGVGRTVGADMFGMALRSYRRKIARLRESSTERGRSLWAAVVEHLSADGGRVVSIGEILERFHLDDEELVRGVLHDLTESSLVFRTGTGWGTRYRLAGTDELAVDPDHDDAGRDALVWITVYRRGALERDDLVGIGGLDAETIDASLARLVADGRISVTRDDTDGTERYACQEVVVGLGAATGWEAAVFDHFQAAVRTITGRLQRQPGRTSARDEVGGSTYTFDLCPDHPMRDEVLGLLADHRERLGELRQRVEQWNREHAPANLDEHLTFYFGQHVTTSDSDT